jgi:Peptidase A4 family
MRKAIATIVLTAAFAVPSLALASPGHGLWRPDTLRNSTSSNWSGYAATGAAGAFTSVSASWVQPTAICGVGQTAASFWVGLDGDGSQTVEQIGAYSNCTADNIPQYYAWFEMYPNPAYKTTYPLYPGDKMSASVSVDRVGRFKLSITDATQRWTASTTQRSTTAQRVSAEVIAEAPSNSLGIVPLTNFGTVGFSAAKVNGAVLDSFSPDRIDMVSGGTTKATTGPLGNGAFSVTWNHS